MDQTNPNYPPPYSPNNSETPNIPNNQNEIYQSLSQDPTVLQKSSFKNKWLKILVPTFLLGIIIFTVAATRSQTTTQNNDRNNDQENNEESPAVNSLEVYKAPDPVYYPVSDETKEKLKDCLELQSFYTGPDYSQSQNNTNFGTLGLVLPLVKENPCQQTAKNTYDLGEIEFLMDSRDPVILISLAANPNTPYDNQGDLYTSDFNYSWRQTVYTDFLSETPKEELFRSFAKNTGVDPEIVKDMIRRYAAGDPEIEAVHLSTLIENSSETFQPNPVAIPFMLDIAKLNVLRFNIEISKIENLNQDVIDYLSQDIEYELSESDIKKYDTNKPGFTQYSSPNEEIHSNLAKNYTFSQDYIKELIYQKRDNRNITISKENIALVADFILEDETEAYFEASTEKTIGGGNQGRYTYVFDLLFYGISGNENVTTGTIQKMIDKYADSQIKLLLQEDPINRSLVWSRLSAKYPSWDSATTGALMNALRTAQETINSRVE